jgi:hypothetical protein
MDYVNLLFCLLNYSLTVDSGIESMDVDDKIDRQQFTATQCTPTAGRKLVCVSFAHSVLTSWISVIKFVISYILVCKCCAIVH